MTKEATPDIVGWLFKHEDKSAPIMGMVMKQVQGKANSSLVSELIRKKVREGKQS